jgi:hypothetical protein
VYQCTMVFGFGCFGVYTSGPLIMGVKIIYNAVLNTKNQKKNQNLI